MTVRYELFMFVLLLVGASVCEGDVVRIVESIPVGVDLDTPMSTFQAWLDIVQTATKSIDISCMYFTLTQGYYSYPHSYGGSMGKEVYDALEAAASKGVEIRILMQAPGTFYNDSDAFRLGRHDNVAVRAVDFAKLNPADAGGILHTKTIVADRQKFYSGSANIDWRALAQVKELGVWVNNAEASEDMSKIFEAYWLSAAHNKTVDPFPSDVTTEYNQQNPMKWKLADGSIAEGYLAVSPPQFASPNVPHREDDLTALLYTINNAEKTLDIEVMDYFPSWKYLNTPALDVYWPDIDVALRNASYRGVRVRFLAGIWDHTDKSMFQYLHSLNMLDNVEVRQITIPSTGISVPFTRVNHAKYCVSEKESYVGTSNWTADYYTNTGGISVNIRSERIAGDVRYRFERDWNSKYTSLLNRN